MSGRVKLIIGLLSITLFVVVWPSERSVRAQSPTKTPIGPPPTKAPLQSDPPTKTPLPTDVPPAAPTATVPTPTAPPRSTTTLLPVDGIPNAVASPTASPVPSTATASPTPTVVAATPTALPPTSAPVAAGLNVDATATPALPLSTGSVNGSSASVDHA